MKLKYTAKRDNGKWIIDGYYWTGCYCNRKPFKVEFDQIVIPKRKQIKEWLEQNK